MMGNIRSYLTRPFRSFNIEVRAQKVIAKDKPTPAPQYASVVKQKELVDKLYPNFMEEHYKKNMQLDDRLKNVYVKSTDPVQGTEEPIKSARPLPEKRDDRDEYDFSFYDATNIPKGKCSLNQAITFLIKHTQEPDVYTAEEIAAAYNLDKNVVENILKYFQVPIYNDQDSSKLREEDNLTTKLA